MPADLYGTNLCFALTDEVKFYVGDAMACSDGNCRSL